MQITTRIIKGGALLEDSRRFVDEWDLHRGPEENLEIFRSSNVLGKRSRSRAEDTLAILRQRFVQPGPEAVRALKVLTVSPDAFRAACYYERHATTIYSPIQLVKSCMHHVNGVG